MPRHRAAVKESRGGALQLGSQEIGSFRPSLHGLCWRAGEEAAPGQTGDEHSLYGRCLTPNGPWYRHAHRSATSVLPWPANRQADANSVSWARRGRLIGRCCSGGPASQAANGASLATPTRGAIIIIMSNSGDEASLERQQTRSCIYAVNEPRLLAEPITPLMNAFQSNFRPR